MRFNTPLRYPGGKVKLANFIKLIIEENGLHDVPYAELYAGGAGVALALLLDEYVSHIHVNDLDPNIYAFWYSVLNDATEMCGMIDSVEITMEEWFQQKDVYDKPDSHSMLELGFATFFLNRTNRSGILTAGVIGGKNQNGPWKLDARFNKDNLIARIQRISRFRNRISLYKCDAADFIANSLPSFPKRTLVYLDPPYYVKGQDLYANYYRHCDHEKIANLVKCIEQSWIVSYDNADEVRRLYSTCESLEYSLSYSAQERYRGAEVMFFSPGLHVPKVPNPAKVSSKFLNSRQLPLISS